MRPACGTRSGYAAHMRRREKPCPDCLAARNRWERQRRQHLDYLDVVDAWKRNPVQRPDRFDPKRCLVCGRPLAEHAELCWRM